MSDKATPIDQWSLDQENHTGLWRSVRVVQAPGTPDFKPGVFLRVTNTHGTPIQFQQGYLSPEQARAVATMLLYAADQAEKTKA